MPRNIEVKVRLSDPHATRALAVGLATQPPAVEVQIDRYYRVDARGLDRCKVRDSDRYGLQLIEYCRPEASGVRGSDYQRTVLAGPDDPRLAGLGEVLRTVTKRREVLWIENVRVHLDEVEDLGSFLELEAVVDGEHPEAECLRRVDELLVALGVATQEPIRASYSDLLAARAAER